MKPELKAKRKFLKALNVLIHEHMRASDELHCARIVDCLLSTAAHGAAAIVQSGEVTRVEVLDLVVGAFASHLDDHLEEHIELRYYDRGGKAGAGHELSDKPDDQLLDRARGNG